MIKAMARAARQLERPDLAESATHAVDFIQSKLWNGDRLLATYKDQRARFPAYLDDYAFLAASLLELLQYRWRSTDVTLAYDLMNALLKNFEDANGGFFFTSHDHETLIHRPKPLADEAIPSGNGIAVQTLILLGHLLGENIFISAAEKALKASGSALEAYPEGHGSMLQALELLLHPPELIIIRGEQRGILNKWKRYASAGYHPRRLSFAIPNDETGLPGFLAEKKPHGEIVAYICRGTECQAPVTRFEEFARILGSSS
jgi:hypothetical protein